MVVPSPRASESENLTRLSPDPGLDLRGGDLHCDEVRRIPLGREEVGGIVHMARFLIRQ